MVYNSLFGLAWGQSNEDEMLQIEAKIADLKQFEILQTEAKITDLK